MWSDFHVGASVVSRTINFAVVKTSATMHYARASFALLVIAYRL
jgi:hypothetical protein